MNQTLHVRSFAAVLGGRSFVHPLFDYLIIGGGLSLIVTAFLIANPMREPLISAAMLPYFILVSNSAHFASSTVRLYTKPGSVQSWPFLTLSFPLVALLVLTSCLLFAGSLGPHLQALYLTWSPYHYAAQAYGLAVVYAHRSGCQLLAWDKRLLWWTSLLPFFYAFSFNDMTGLRWLLPAAAFQHPLVAGPYQALAYVLPIASIAAIGLLSFKAARGASGPLPIISVMMLIANAAWWCFLPNSSPLAPVYNPPAGRDGAPEPFVWATIFHGLQYLGIVTIFHVKDQLARSDNRRGWLFHVASFYGGSLLLAYALFSCLPWGFVMAGFGMFESVTLCIAAINIHHFIVDAYIWRLKKGDRNRAIVESGQATAMAPEMSAAAV